MQINLPRSFDCLDDLFDFLQAFFVKYDIPRVISFPVSLATEEIITNCIKYNPCGGGRIAVTLEHKGKYLELTIIDGGTAFNPEDAPEPDINSPLPERKTGGLGLFLAKQIMDRIKYLYEDGKNIVILRKNLEP